MNWVGWSAFNVYAQGDASDAAKVKYLLKVAEIQANRIATLEMMLKTNGLAKEIDRLKLTRLMDALKDAKPPEKMRKRPFFWWLDRLILGRKLYEERERIQNHMRNPLS